MQILSLLHTLIYFGVNTFNLEFIISCFCICRTLAKFPLLYEITTHIELYYSSMSYLNSFVLCKRLSVAAYLHDPSVRCRKLVLCVLSCEIGNPFSPIDGANSIFEL